MAKNLVFANEEEINVADDSVIEGQLLTVETATDEADQSLDMQDESMGILETTNSMIELTEQAVDSGEGLPASTAVAINAAMEHFYNRAGIDLGKGKILALESNSVKTALSDTRTALEDMKSFSKRLDKAVVISQEGIMSRLGNTFKLAFTSQDKIHDNILINLNNLKSRGVKTTNISEPGWGRSFAIQGTRLVNGSEVVKMVKEYTSILTSSQMKSLINDYTDLIEVIEKEVSKGLFVANDEAVKNIYELGKKAESFRVKVDKIVATNKRPAKNDPDYVPLTESEAQKLADMVNHMFSDGELRTAIKRCDTAISGANLEIFGASMTRLIGPHAADIRAARTIINKTNGIISDITYIIGRMNRVAFACSNYIKSSTAR